jgi:hypothetical protein
MDPYETLGITPGYDGDLRALRNRLVKRYFEAGETPDEERMKAINLAYESLLDRARRPPVTVTKPFSIVTRALPAARVGEPYRAPLALSGGAAPYTWEAELPAGLRLDAAGTLSGRLEAAGSVSLALTVTDREGRTANRVFVLHVAPAPPRVRAHDATIGVPCEPQVLVDGGVAPLPCSGAPPADHAAGIDVAATRARIAALDARRTLDRATIAAALLAAATAAALLSLVVGWLAVAPAGAALLYALGPTLLAPARRAEAERLRALLGCGRVDCPRCR